jgi:hypothetical protein
MFEDYKVAYIQNGVSHKEESRRRLLLSDDSDFKNDFLFLLTQFSVASLLTDQLHYIFEGFLANYFLVNASSPLCLLPIS